MGIPAAAVEQYRTSQRLQAVAQLKARHAWALVQVGAFSESWESLLVSTGLVSAVTQGQLKNAAAGAAYGARSLADQGLYDVPEAFVNPAGFAGVAADGRTLGGLLYAAVPHTKNLIGGGMGTREALSSGGKFLELIVKTSIADAGRGAAGVDTFARPNTGYVRMLNPPSCARCSLLAGKFYKHNQGFKRHPGCDCIHVPSQASETLKSEGLIHDPYEYFKGLSEAEQNKLYTKGGAQAIRDGGDLFQVVNSQRGVSYAGVAKDGTNRGLKRSLTTTEGTTKRGNFGRGRGPRLTPEGIYAQNLPREQSLKLLEKNGYLFSQGQNPAGVIRGEGYGFSSKQTMTAAQKRVQDASLNWQAVQQGRNPLGKSPLTPKTAAAVEDAYRKMLTTNGEVFTR